MIRIVFVSRLCQGSPAWKGVKRCWGQVCRDLPRRAITGNAFQPGVTP